jgi:phosphohistidine phosphatase SixA
MLVGHEPDFSSVISALSGASLKLSKAGVALVDIDQEAKEEDFSGCSRRNSRAKRNRFFSRSIAPKL